jgi:hypothetical protein
MSTAEKALIRAIAGGVKCAARAHPDKIDPAIAGSITKRIMGQLLAQFDIKQKQQTIIR